ncbi:hypothetical protein RKE29_07135 [Streptomyces sp. B1866]|uniref:hypothetical protein n=1 Tax=Streptomyces sp. B1866 TaxID=3075431 RepID=UPI00288D6ABF|nr:hypothetical protein [Streptomyces sp. B1866]MDT3396416.1 hypothetical protein [Streptomyces sp. B1866]
MPEAAAGALTAAFGRVETRGARGGAAPSRERWTPGVLGWPRPPAAATTVGHAA